MKVEKISHMEITYSFNCFTKLLFYLSSIMHVLLTVYFGDLLSLKPTLNLLIFLFAVSSKLFAMMFAEDRKASKKTKICSTIPLALSVFLLKELPSFQITIGISILILYSIYPIIDRKAVLDIMHHTLRYVLIFTLGYGQQNFNNGTTLLALLCIALLSIAGELLVGLTRNSDSLISRSTASLLGIKKSLIIIISLIFIASLLFSYVFHNIFEFPIQINKTFFPFYIIPSLSLSLFLTKPLIETLKGKHIDLFHSIRKKEAITMILMSFLVLTVLEIGRINTDVEVNSRNYIFHVGIRTIIAGRNSWEVPWIVFDYINQDNFYYIILHKNGILELSQKMDGEYKRYIASLETQLTPFEWHNFHIILKDATIAVILDGKYQLTTSRHSKGDTFRIIISPPSSRIDRSIYPNVYQSIYYSLNIKISGV